MTTDTAAGESAGLRRPALAGFGVGFAMAFLATVLALLSTFFERIHPVLVPASELLAPWADAFADWNGLLSMTLAAGVNGLLYAAVFTVVAAATRAVRRA